MVSIMTNSNTASQNTESLPYDIPYDIQRKMDAARARGDWFEWRRLARLGARP